MPELILLLVLVLAIGGVAITLTGARRPRTPSALPSARARWRAGHRTEESTTVVHVVLTEPADGAPALERRDVGRIANSDPDYDRRLAELMDVARQRAVLLDLNRE